ncbi:alpha/beta hydrolase [Haliangium sp.]|uniref:alpha/beta hydrolase n=1 Tax=Haliangium sp. TaxID=2663208 RepID=UPI003D13CFC3
MSRLCIVPRWSGGPDSDFYPWLRAQPAVRARFSAVIGPSIERPDEPTIEAWLTSLGAALDLGALTDTYLLGHSVGCQAVLRFLEQAPAGARAAGVLCVAGWWSVDQPWDSIRPWIETPMDHARVRQASEQFSVLMSDNDPFTADWEHNARLWRERLGAEVHTIPGRKHFNEAEEPAVVDALLALAGPA